MKNENKKIDLQIKNDIDSYKQPENNENQFYDKDYITSLRNKAKTNWLKNIDHEEWLNNVRGR